MTEELLEPLDAQQKKAVLINDGSLVVFAGAGSGKTRVITTKIAWIILNSIAKPWEILAVTFTNKACREMQQRVGAMIGEQRASECMIKTFHSFGVWLLRRFSEQAGLARNFSIYDDHDSAVLMHQCFPDYPKKETDAAARRVAGFKDRMERPNARHEMFAYYNAYQKKLQETGNVDFADMILRSISLLENNPDVLNWVHNRFKVILVDEYQDSNAAQFNMLRLLAGPSSFVCVVGDDDQSIYRFRGAKVENILNFSRQFANTRTVVLGKNYRCTEPILAVARDVILNNSSRAEKELTAWCTKGQKPRLYYVNTEYDEAQKVVDIIKGSIKDPGSLDSTAILYRTNAQSKVFEDRLIMNGIPYRLVGSLRFYDREEIRDAIALVSLLVNPQDSVAFERMINKPARGIGPATVRRITEQGPDVLGSAVSLVENGVIKGKAAEGIRSFVNAREKCVGLLGTLDNGELVHRLLTEFGINSYYQARDREEDYSDSRLGNLNQLVNMLTAPDFSTGIEGIHAFLEYVALDPSSLGSAQGASDHGVTLITMHNTKGLEFDRVFMTGLEDELFPSLREDSTNEDLEEERRICYVAMTRARKELYLFCSSSRMLWGNKSYRTPSRFISEIDENHLDVVDERQANLFFHQRPLYKSYYSRTSYSKGQDSTAYLKPGRDDYEDWQPKKKAVLIKKGTGIGADTPREKVDWKVGDRVNSDLMGNGTITAMRKFGSRDILVVDFDDGRMGNYVAERADLTKLPIEN